MKSALTTAFVLTACVSFAQAPGPRADLVGTTLPLEVIGSVPEPGAASRQQNAEDLCKAIEWPEKENASDS